MELGTLLLVALVLACPIGMMWMMRGKHGRHESHSRGTDDRGQPAADPRERVAGPAEQPQVRASGPDVLGDEHGATTDVHRRRDVP